MRSLAEIIAVSEIKPEYHHKAKSVCEATLKAFLGHAQGLDQGDKEQTAKIVAGLILGMSKE